MLWMWFMVSAWRGLGVPFSTLQEKFLHDKIKVDNKTGNLGERVKITAEGAKIVVSAEVCQRCMRIVV